MKALLIASRIPCRAANALAAMLLLTAQTPVSAATFTETEPNDTKAAANVFDFGTATTATITGTSANSTAAENDYFRFNTSYTTPGIYVNQLQFTNQTQNVGSIRALTQTTGTVNAGTDAVFQTTTTSGTATPLGFSQYYSFGGAGKTQSVYYKVVGAGTTTGGAYTANFTSTRITPASIGTFRPGRITLAAQANLGGTGGTTVTNTSVVVFDSNFNVYYDSVVNSSTFGYAASNDNPAGNASQGFNLGRAFAAGTYYVAIGISNVATNQAAAPDDGVRGNAVLDFGNVIATNNTFYNGNNNAPRPSDFTVTDSDGNTYTSSGQVIPSLYALNFYTFTVSAVPEPGTVAGLLVGGLALVMARRRRSS